MKLTLIKFIFLLLCTLSFNSYTWSSTIASEIDISKFGSFSALPEVTLLPGGKIKLNEDLSFKDPQSRTWLVKKGFVSDGASIPRPFWPIVGAPLSGNHRDAAIIHDHFCERRVHDPELVHKTFYMAMLANEVDPTTAWVMFKAVSWFGPYWKTIEEVPKSCEPGPNFSPDDCVINFEVVDVERPLTQDRFDAFIEELRAKELNDIADKLRQNISLE